MTKYSKKEQLKALEKVACYLVYDICYEAEHYGIPISSDIITDEIRTLLIIEELASGLANEVNDFTGCFFGDHKMVEVVNTYKNAGLG